jgi:6,7-dimethyl-8-ribityllumazine synthase
MASAGNTNLLQLNTGIPLKNACIVMVKTEWNAAIVDELQLGCTRVFNDHGIGHLHTLIVPGAVEISFAIKAYFDAKKYSDDRPHAFIALGCVIKGDTPHFEYVCQAVTNGVMHLNLQLPVPVIFGVLTVNTEAQARERIGGIHGHKGEEPAITALKMIGLQQSFKQ